MADFLAASFERRQPTAIPRTAQRGIELITAAPPDARDIAAPGRTFLAFTSTPPRSAAVLLRATRRPARH